MSTEFLHGALRLAVLILLLALVMLPFQPRASGEFVVTVMAAIVGGLFVLAVIVLLRWSTPRLPPALDDQSRKALNGPPPRTEEGSDP
jgi:fumarate reductase subunit D